MPGRGDFRIKDRASLTYEAFAHQSQGQRPRWMYPAVAIGILAVLAISIPTLLRVAGPGLTRAASISKAKSHRDNCGAELRVCA